MTSVKYNYADLQAHANALVKSGKSEIGARISAAMIKTNMQQTTLAAEIDGVSKAYLSMMINGQRPFQKTHIESIAKILGVDKNWLESGKIPYQETLPPKTVVTATRLLPEKGLIQIDFTHKGTMTVAIPNQTVMSR